MFKFFYVCLLLIYCGNVNGQHLLSITGQIRNGKGEGIEAAVVLIDGTASQTKSDRNGRFEIPNIPSGTYDIAVRMVGYGPQKKSILVRGSTILNFILEEKVTLLKEVMIGDDSKRTKNLQTFKDYFIGRTDNALSCVIENPDVLSFTTNKNTVIAEANSFLVIKNKNLGYRIKYFLRNFIYNGDLQLTKYDGECVFEDLIGSEKEMVRWKSNRKKAYEGSFMHYLRTLHSKDQDKGEFITHEYIDAKRDLISEPIDVYQFVEKLDSNFIKLAFKQKLCVFYNKEGFKKSKDVPIQKELTASKYNEKGIYPGVVNMYLDYTIIDKTGHYQDSRSFLLNNKWGRLQVGDRLPYSYQP